MLINPRKSLQGYKIEFDTRAGDVIREVCRQTLRRIGERSARQYEPSLHIDQGSEGGFRWSSQHLELEVLMGTVKQRQRAVQAYRGQVPLLGRPTVAWREDGVRVWAAIARGVMTEDAAAEAGVSSPVAFRSRG